MKKSWRFFLAVFLLTILNSCQKDNTSPSEGMVEDPDGRAYQWKKMPDGNLWLVENLDFYIPGESWAYANEPSNRNRYGLLYTVEGARLACEALGDGWRLATDKEWMELAAYYGNLDTETELVYQAMVDPAEDPDSGTGESGFNARFGGYYNPSGDFAYFEKGGFYWTDSRKSSGSYWHYVFDGTTGEFVRFHMSGAWGFSCRCVSGGW